MFWNSCLYEIGTKYIRFVFVNETFIIKLVLIVLIINRCDYLLYKVFFGGKIVRDKWTKVNEE